MDRIKIVIAVLVIAIIALMAIAWPWGLVALIVLALVWLYMSINILKPNEMGVKVRLGKPKDVVDSGFHFTLWPFESIIRYTKELMEFKFMVGSIMTKRGKVKGYDEAIEPANVNIVCTIFAKFDKDSLLKTVMNAPGRTAQDLGPFLVPYVTDIIRALGGRIPWRLINQSRRHFAIYVLARLVHLEDGYPNIIEKKREIGFNPDLESWKKIEEDGLGKSPFAQFGLTNVSFVIEDVSFVDEDLNKAVSASEKARLEAAAIRIKAEAEKLKRTREGEGSAKARAAMIKVIKENPGLEVLEAFKELTKGQGHALFYQIPTALSQQIEDMLGGNKVTDLLRLLSEKDRESVLKTIEVFLKKSKASV